MFEGVLLDSSPTRAPVLKGRHWLISTLAGLAALLTARSLLPLVFMAAEPRIVLAQAGIVGVIAFGYSLALCYVWADARHQGLMAWPWLMVTLMLNLPGFLIYLVYSAARTGNWKRATVPIAYIAQAALVGVMILVPMIYTEALPEAVWKGIWETPTAPPGPPPRAPAPQPNRARYERVDEMTEPPSIPTTIAVINEPPEPPPVDAGSGFPGVPGGIPNGIPGGMSPTVFTALTPPPPLPPPIKPAQIRRVHVGGVVQGAKLIFQPTLEYPPLAKMMRIQGTVQLEAIIGKDGIIQDLRVLNGHPWLAKAALENVARWRYQPTLLNGEPVEVATEIAVNFRLAD